MNALMFQRPIDNPLSYISNPYGNWYQIRPGVENFHTGIDVVSQQGSCKGWPILAVAWGVVTYAERVMVAGYEVWGNLIIIRHQFPDGTVVYSRSAHGDNLQVKAGDTVHPGQHIADVSNAFGAYPYHLHFDISPTSVLAHTPWDWPGADKARVLANYVDPVSFIRERLIMGADYTALDAAMQNVQAAAVDMQKAVDAFKKPPDQLPGTAMVVTADSLNVRLTPSIAQAPVASLVKNDVVQVIDASPAPWKQIVYGQFNGKYVNGNYLTPKA